MTSLALGIDVGGTAIKACVATIDGEIVREWSEATGAERGADAVVRTIVETAHALVDESRSFGTLVGIGLVVPGQVDESAGVAVYSSNIGWRDVPLRESVARETGVRVALGHDVRAGALAEALWGAARDYETSLFIPLGTGLAAAFVSDHVALAGVSGLAGDIGHLQLAPSVEPCGCGRSRCLESVSSASAIARRYSDASGRRAAASEVARLVDAGDPVATQVWNEAIDPLADAIISAATLLDPGVVVVGGGLSESGETLFGALRVALASEPSVAERIVPAGFGSKSGMIGAASLAWRDVR